MEESTSSALFDLTTRGAGGNDLSTQSPLDLASSGAPHGEKNPTAGRFSTEQQHGDSTTASSVQIAVTSAVNTSSHDGVTTSNTRTTVPLQELTTPGSGVPDAGGSGTMNWTESLPPHTTPATNSSGGVTTVGTGTIIVGDKNGNAGELVLFATCTHTDEHKRTETP